MLLKKRSDYLNGIAKLVNKEVKDLSGILEAPNEDTNNCVLRAEKMYKKSLPGSKKEKKALSKWIKSLIVIQEKVLYQESADDNIPNKKLYENGVRNYLRRIKKIKTFSEMRDNFVHSTTGSEKEKYAFLVCLKLSSNVFDVAEVYKMLSNRTELKKVAILKMIE